MKKLFLCIFLLVSVFVDAQTTLTGTIISKSNNEPIERASIYINGTTVGAYSDKDGRFKLESVQFPCVMVISHLAHELKVIHLNASVGTDMKIILAEKMKQLGEVFVSSTSLRAKNVADFKKAFLGTDSWGNKAKLSNDSDLVFMRQQDTILVSSALHTQQYTQRHTSLLQPDSLAYTKKVMSTFTVSSRAPLLIELPLLGYRVSVDLQRFVCAAVESISYNSILGYFRFTPYANASKSKQATYERNRRKVYYNSTMHFIRSLYDNKLRENGYVVFNTKLFVPDSVLSFDGAEEGSINNQKGESFRIYYIAHSNGKPIDLSKEKIDIVPNNGLFIGKYANSVEPQSASWVLFKSDKCKIRKNGLIDDSTILFKGYMGDKKVGAILPDDYNPETITKLPDGVVK